MTLYNEQSEPPIYTDDFNLVEYNVDEEIQYIKNFIDQLTHIEKNVDNINCDIRFNELHIHIKKKSCVSKWDYVTAILKYIPVISLRTAMSIASLLYMLRW